MSGIPLRLRHDAYLMKISTYNLTSQRFDWLAYFVGVLVFIWGDVR